MSRTTICPNCRKAMPSLGAFLSGNVELSGIAIGCPHCGHSVPVKDGKYSIIDGAIKAFTAPGMTREKVQAAKSIVEGASSGAITTQDAVRRLEAVSATLAQVVAQPQNPKIDWGLWVALLALIYTIWNDHKSDADAQAALAESRTQTEVAQKILAESQAQSESLSELATRPNLRPQFQEQKNAPKNRADRRKVASIERRGR